MTTYEEKIQFLDHAWKNSQLGEQYTYKYRILARTLQGKYDDPHVRVLPGSRVFFRSSRCIHILSALCRIDALHLLWSMQKCLLLIHFAHKTLTAPLQTSSSMLGHIGASIHHGFTLIPDCLALLLECIFILARAGVRYSLMLAWLFMRFFLDLNTLVDILYAHVFMNDNTQVFLRLLLLFTIVPLYYIKQYLSWLFVLLNQITIFRFLFGGILSCLYFTAFLTSNIMSFIWDNITLVLRSLPPLLTAFFTAVIRCFCQPSHAFYTFLHMYTKCQYARLFLIILLLLCVTGTMAFTASTYYLGLWPMLIYHIVQLPRIILTAIPPIPTPYAIGAGLLIAYLSIQLLLHIPAAIWLHMKKSAQRAHDLSGRKWRLRLGMLTALYHWLIAATSASFWDTMNQSEHLFENNLYYSLQHGLGHRFLHYFLLAPCPNIHSFWHGKETTSHVQSALCQDTEDEESTEEYYSSFEY